MTTFPLSGVYPAIATPIDRHGEPDAEKFLALARHLMANGADGLNVLGTTGEATSFSVEQREGLMTALARSGIALKPMMVGTGAAAVADAVRLTRHAAELGFGGALVLPPFYFKGVPADGVVRYIEALVKATAATAQGLYLYNFPALAGVAYDLALVTRLNAEFGARIAGLKDSSGDLPYARAVAAIRPGLAVFPSNEACLSEARTGIFAGCISATANVNADLCGKAWRTGDEKAYAAAVAIRKLFDGLPLQSAVKSLLAHLHGDASLAETLPPLSRLGAEARSRLVAGYDAIRKG